MKRQLQDFEKVKINLNIFNEVQYQDIFEARKRKIEENLPSGMWQGANCLTWEEIERKAFEIIKKNGTDFKLFSLWCSASLFLHGWKELLFVLEVIIYFLQEKKEILEEELSIQEGFINFLDKTITNSLVEIPFKLSSKKFFNYNELNELKVNILSHLVFEDIEEIKNFCSDISLLLKTFENLSFSFQVRFNKIYSCIESILSIITSYNYAKNKLDQDCEQDQNELEEELDLNDFQLQKEEAFEKILSAITILYKIDPKNIAIPLLKKSLLWKDHSILQVLKEMEEVGQISSLIKLIG